ncbi:transketolase [Komagataeibacter swingsii]|uniref:Transketolase n=1 Tax=Komagataeibacter swingsii TaxID=215220 RepID=A0A850P0B2_9PROT|nr:transketolase [Komagataeibacter swingsii]NVN36140.1 transketolase [Komagataeibacter swingsii]
MDTVNHMHHPDAPSGSMDLLAINTIRTLAIDAIQKANSGHPGTPMGLAPASYVLWRDILKYDPAAPGWINRDRFVLSVGHASSMLYATLFLAGVREMAANGHVTDRLAVTLDDIRQFRQLGSRTPGHPEYGVTTGVETTTGPLGQGLAVSVGMAIAQAWLARHFNRPGHDVFDHHIYAFSGEGCLMEGISAEAASLAGHLQLGHLVWLYDCNRISIEGNVDITFTENLAARFRAAGWDVLEVADINDLATLRATLRAARDDLAKPTFVITHSIIGYGSPHKADKASAHGAPLGVEEVRETKRAYGWPEDAQFLVPDGVPEHMRSGMQGARAHAAWRTMMESYRRTWPDLAAELDRMEHGGMAVADIMKAACPDYAPDPVGRATRETSGEVLNAVAQAMPFLLGGSGDLAPSNKSALTFKGTGWFESPAWQGDYSGRNFHFGIREHAMGAICNGMASYRLRPYAATFLVFMDYMKTPIRLAAMMGLPVIYIFTHDSIGMGEDGPTHQPIEHLLQLRGIPNLLTIRPADANEVAVAWQVAMQSTSRPVAFALSRQALPTIDRSRYGAADGLRKGGYVVADMPDPQLILIATGGELHLAMSAHEKLGAEGVATRVVSLPCWELFEEQPQSYRDSVLPPAVTRRVTIEAGCGIGWERYAGPQGRIIAMHSFGASAPYQDLMQKFGFTEDAVLTAARSLL